MTHLSYPMKLTGTHTELYSSATSQENTAKIPQHVILSWTRPKTISMLNSGKNAISAAQKYQSSLNQLNQ